MPVMRIKCGADFMLGWLLDGHGYKDDVLARDFDDRDCAVIILPLAAFERMITHLAHRAVRRNFDDTFVGDFEELLFELNIRLGGRSNSSGGIGRLFLRIISCQVQREHRHDSRGSS